MKDGAKNKNTCTRLKIAAVVLAAISVVLIAGSFFVPPTGIIDGSVVLAVGELFAFATLFMVWEAIDKGIDAKLTHNGTSVEFNNPDDESTT